MKKTSSRAPESNRATYAMQNIALALFLTIATVGTFVGGLWAIVGIGGAVVLLVAVIMADRRLPRPAVDLSWMAVVALAIMALMNVQSSRQGLSWFEWQRLGTVFLPLLLLSSPQIQARINHPKLFAWLPYAAMAAAIALGIELFTGGPLLKLVRGLAAPMTDYNRGISYLVVLAFPILAALWNRGKQGLLLSGIFIVILLFPTSLTESRAAKLALVVGLVVTMTALLWPIVTRYVLSALPVLFIGWPFAAQYFFRVHYDLLARFPDSWRARMEIWDYMSYRIMERPVFGWGLGASSKLDFQNPDGARYVWTKVAASHPHDAIVQLWVELGLPGLALGIGFAHLTLYKAGQLDRKLAPFAMGAWAAGLCLAMVAFSLWTDSLFAAFAMTGLAFALLDRKIKEK